MWRPRLFLAVISVIVGPLLYVVGLLQPQAVLLDMPFGLAFYIADLLGMWRPGLLWGVNEHRFLAIFCGLGWPLLFSVAVSYAVALVAYKIWNWRKKGSPLYAMLFLMIFFVIILSVRVRPASYFVSYYGYWTANY